MNMSSVAQAYLFACAKNVACRGKWIALGTRLWAVWRQLRCKNGQSQLHAKLHPIQLSAWISYLSGDERELGEKRTLKKV